ncbi:hypothetical protein LQ772_06910 [Frateuria edaphi]|uniref:hypothetical protein n=1 Tax=Frateuria edaphi TaxID=2898793 RepID=UPI001E43ED10|nr:hypothetical protein [Frateuria edaphi]UGB47016.1 hypothetical protein LQ772_06910 [Frateuria edaphi]
MPEAPDARELFRLLREHLKQSGASGLILRDPEGDLYLACDPDLDSLCGRVLRLANWQRRERREPDVMADTGEIVLDFKPTYPRDR